MLSYDYSEDNFFDASEYIDTLEDCYLSDGNFIENKEVQFDKYGYEIWTTELMSIEERRKKFLREMGFHELIQYPINFPVVSNLSGKEMNVERIVKESITEFDSLSPLHAEGQENFVSHTSDIDGARRFILRDIEHDRISGAQNDVDSSKSISLQEFEMLIGPNNSVQNIFKRRFFRQVEKSSSCLKRKETKLSRWWRSFKQQREDSKSFKHEPSIANSQLPRLMLRKIWKQSRCKEVTALYVGQEIKGHKGLIRTMKFSPSGRYLASGGEDCTVLIWQISEIETCCNCFLEASTKSWNNSSGCSAPIIIPQRFFKIDEAPLQALLGHTSDILDLSWSNSNMLVTSSMDKTVRLWKVGHDGCLKVFQHSDYVTCVQFVPFDSRYFISGSIDGKVRMWGVTDNRVAEWVDTRDIVTSLCHRPDGKGFFVGSISGKCHYYDYSVNNFLSMKLSFCSKRRSSAKSITGLQCFPEDSQKVIITSANSRIRILDGADAVLKLKGHKRVKSQFSPSISSDGKHIISMGDDSHVYIWNYDESNKTSSKGGKSIHFCESFFSEGASIAVSWCGMYQEEEVLGADDDPLSSSRTKMSKPSPRPSDKDPHSRDGWLFSDVASRVSATWPEENLASTNAFPSHAGTCHNSCHHRHHEYYASVKPVALTCSRVILTGGFDGTIRTFYYYGCPIKL